MDKGEAASVESNGWKRMSTVLQSAWHQFHHRDPFIFNAEFPVAGLPQDGPSTWVGLRRSSNTRWSGQAPGNVLITEQRVEAAAGLHVSRIPVAGSRHGMEVARCWSSVQVATEMQSQDQDRRSDGGDGAVKAGRRC